MLSIARASANAANAQLSTGPRSTAGLARSSKNATRHGLAATSVVVLESIEDAAEYEAMLADVLDDLAPVGAVEIYLAERVAQILWRLRRVLRFETTYLSQWQLDILPSAALLDAERQAQTKRDCVLAALACLFLTRDQIIDEHTVATVLDASLETLHESERSVFVGGPGEPLQILAVEASAPPFTVGAVLDFLRLGGARVGISSRRFTVSAMPTNFVAEVYQFWAGAERQSRRISAIADRSAERQQTEGLLLQNERAATLVERYEPKLRRDLSKTLSDILNLQAKRKGRDSEDSAFLAERTQSSADGGRSTRTGFLSAGPRRN